MKIDLYALRNFAIALGTIPMAGYYILALLFAGAIAWQPFVILSLVGVVILVVYAHLKTKSDEEDKPNLE